MDTSIYQSFQPQMNTDSRQTIDERQSADGSAQSKTLVRGARSRFGDCDAGGAGIAFTKMTTDITWRPELGDMTLMGWVITMAYGVAAALCLRCGIRSRSENDQGKAVVPRRTPQTWLAVAGMLLLLGLNKQLDLQTLFIQAGREIAVAAGWYGERRRLQMVFVLVLGTVMTSALLTLIWKRRRFFQQHPLTLPGSVLLVLYVLVRAGSLDHVDEAVGLHLDDSKWIAGMELSGILCFAVAGVRAAKTVPQQEERA